MKNTRKIFYISAAFALLAAVISCGNPFPAPGGNESASSDGEVIIRIAGSDGRTILPKAPTFSKYELFLQKEGAEQTQVDNVEGIESSGVPLRLSGGKWTITLKAYQDIFKDGVGVLAASGSAEITVDKGDSQKTVLITLKPLPISEASDIPGLFSFKFTLPQGVQNAVLILKNESGVNQEFNLVNENSGSVQLNAGYYDMSVLLEKNGQNAGLFESAHIYSGLESQADIDLSDIVFVDKVYLAGTLGGVRLGKIQFFDENKTFIKELVLDNESKAERTSDWITDIPSSNIGRQVYITQEFNGEATVEISPQAAGKDDIVLSLIPSAVQLKNIAPWYSTVKASGGENPQLAADDNSETFWNSDLSSGPAWLELDYGFNVTVNDAQIIFSGGTSPASGVYSVEYWNGAAWIQAGSRALNGAKEYNSFFRTVSASKFRLNISGASGTASVAEFGLSLTTDRVPQILQAAGSYHTVTLVWKETQKTDAYKVNYKYTVDGGDWINAAAAPTSAFERDASNNVQYTFKPDGYDNALRAGLELQFMVEAINNTTGDSISSEEDARANLIGPALLAPSASAATSINNITVSWDKVEGAGAYYVFRRQFNMNNTAQEGTAIVYYVPGAASGSIAVTGKELKSGADTTTVKAAASVAGSRFTLTDSWMTDAEYSGDYSGYGAYRDQQNELAWGKPYRYFIVPVLANEPLASISYTGGADYTIQGETVTNAASFEKTGFTVGFGQNVTATKGTYASTGNVNNGIQITWEKPPLLSGSPQYTLYRRKSGDTGEWTELAKNQSAASYNDTAVPGKGVAYEYAVGISGSDPRASSRFIDLGYTQLDTRNRPNMLGFVIDMTKMDSVSRNEQKVGSDFAEEVKWKNAGITHRGGTAYKWGVDGYEVWVMNRNVSANWNKIADVTNILDQESQSVKVTNVKSGDTLEAGLLKVLRDYKHFFKVRNYVLNGSNKIYSPDPSYTYTHARNDSSAYNDDPYNTDPKKIDPYHTEYVMWGARQVTPTELVKIATLIMAWGIDQAGGSWQTTVGGYTVNTNGNNGSSGKVFTKSSSGVGMWWFDFTNYKPDMDINSNRGDWDKSVTFLTIDTNSNMDGSSTTQTGRTIFAESDSAGYKPNFYGYLPSTYNSNREYGKDYFDVKGPLDVPDLYTAKMRFNSDVTTEITTGLWNKHNCRAFKWGSNNNDGYVEVLYPSNAAASVKVFGGQTNTPLPFKSQSGSNRRNGDAWY